MNSFEAEKIEIYKTLKRIEAAENRKDVDAMFEDLTEDAILQKSGAPRIQGIEAWREDYKKFFETFVHTIITPLEIQISSSFDLAWDYGTFLSEFEATEGRTVAEGKYLSVYKKVNGKWKGVAVSIS